jgi:hypothetical protein
MLLRLEREGAHEAGDACEIEPDAECHQGDPHPVEGGFSGTGGAKHLHPNVPSHPELRALSWRSGSTREGYR